jgi:hypothetical protein
MHASPQIDLVAQVDRQNEITRAIICKVTGKIRLVGRVAHRACFRSDTDGGGFIRQGITNLRTRSAKVGFRRFQRLIRGIDLSFQRIQSRVVEDASALLLNRF